MNTKHSEQYEVGQRLVYDDGRPGHTGVKATVQAVQTNGILVQFDDRADSTFIKFTDPAWMNHIKTDLFKFNPDLDIDGSGMTSNGQRADNGANIRQIYAGLAGFNEADMKENYSISDMLVDLGHLADREGLDFQHIVDSALRCWNDERTNSDLK